MTVTVPPGDIVTVPDPITGGAGAPVMTAEVFNAMWKNAQAKSLAGDARVGAAIALADPPPQLLPVTLDTSYDMPTAPVLPDINPLDTQAMYDAERDQLTELIQDSMAGFISSFFPRMDYYDDAMAWCDGAIKIGGTGLNPAVEQALWERDRARIMADSARQEDDAMSAWANRGFPLPPGALTNQVNEIRLDAGRKLAESSRTVAIKSFDTEVDNVRFAVKTVIDQRKVALDAMGDYIKTIMLGPQVAMQLATGLANIRTETARALVQMYSAETAALEPRVRLQIADADIRMRGEEANLRSQEASVDAKVKAALAGAQMVATQAAAGLNALHASTGISGSDSSSL